MNSTWSEKAWSTAEPFYNTIKELSFIKELMDGSLAQQKFMHYIAQDSIYLGEYGRVLAGVGAKLSNSLQRGSFLKFASDTVFVEQELHKGFKESTSANSKCEPTPTCLLYTSFLHKQLAMEPVEVAVAAILPCFVMYKKVGDYILQNQSSSDNPYQKWINTYGGEDFALAVRQAEEIVNDLAEKVNADVRQKMIDVYIIATKMEWMFWNSAYELEKWPL
jgi:thiaminase/transcriptional activator TenA